MATAQAALDELHFVFDMMATTAESFQPMSPNAGNVPSAALRRLASSLASLPHRTQPSAANAAAALATLTAQQPTFLEAIAAAPAEQQAAFKAAWAKTLDLLRSEAVGALPTETGGGNTLLWLSLGVGALAAGYYLWKGR